MNGTATKDDRPAAADAAVENTALAPTRPTEPPAVAERTPVRLGIAPRTLDEGWRLAKAIAVSELVPKQYRDKPGDVLIAMQYGLELGFPPMQALQSIAVINGRPSVWGDGFLALILGSDAYREHDEYFLVGNERREYLTPDDLKRDDTTAVAKFWRRDRQNPIVGVFSVGQAKTAKLLGKEGPWQTYPDRMLKMRARGFAGRDGFADILRGVKSTEELLDTPNEELPDLPARPEPITPRRASEARASSSLPAPTTAPAPSPTTQPAATSANAAPAPASTNGASAVGLQEIRGLLITKTQFVRPKQGEPYYEVTAKTSTGDERTFVTRDEQVYKEAVSFEGTDHQVTAAVSESKEKAKVLVLERLAIYEGDGSQLFD